MWKLAMILFIIIGPRLAGLGALVPLSIYGVGTFNALLLVGGAATGAAIAIPVSYWVATRIGALMDASSART